jgi:8-oxo-dGTP pyrophosphatase MutT (NUDIX family)
MKQSPARVSQAAVVAVRRGRVCLITSSSGKRWLVPKGNRQRGCNLRETAAREAWEEAGLVGTVRQRPLGVYEFVKLGKLHEVVVYGMRVSEAKRDWPEKQKRRRRWLRPGKAAERIAHLQLREIVAAAFERNDRAA